MGDEGPGASGEPRGLVSWGVLCWLGLVGPAFQQETGSQELMGSEEKLIQPVQIWAGQRPEESPPAPTANCPAAPCSLCPYCAQMYLPPVWAPAARLPASDTQFSVCDACVSSSHTRVNLTQPPPAESPRRSCSLFWGPASSPLPARPAGQSGPLQPADGFPRP